MKKKRNLIIIILTFAFSNVTGQFAHLITEEENSHKAKLISDFARAFSVDNFSVQHLRVNFFNSQDIEQQNVRAGRTTGPNDKPFTRFILRSGTASEIRFVIEPLWEDKKGADGKLIGWVLKLDVSVINGVQLTKLGDFKYLALQNALEREQIQYERWLSGVVDELKFFKKNYDITVARSNRSKRPEFRQAVYFTLFITDLEEQYIKDGYLASLRTKVGKAVKELLKEKAYLEIYSSEKSDRFLRFATTPVDGGDVIEFTSTFKQDDCDNPVKMSKARFKLSAERDAFQKIYTQYIVDYITNHL